MNEKEQRVLALLRQNPFLSQQEMAEQLQMSRPAVANILSSCMKEGKLLGRAYVFPETKHIVCIGGANVDRKIHIRGKLHMATSNPATSSETVGGVARNIAENLGRLGESVRLVTVAGDDAAWATIEEQSAPYMNVAAVERLATHQTGTYTAILDEHGDLVLAAADMDIYEMLTQAWLQKHEQLLIHAKYIVADLNCPKESIMYLQQVASAHDVPLIIVPVSSPKMAHLPDDSMAMTWLLCNRDEAETIVGYRLQTDEQFEQALRTIQTRGVKNVVMTNGSDAIWLLEANGHITTVNVPPVEQVVDVTGAGDAFVSAFVYGIANEYDVAQALQFAIANARETIQTPHTVRKNITKHQLHMEA